MTRSANPAEFLLKAFNGNRLALAERFDVSVDAVRAWLKSGIPADKALDVEEATMGTCFEISATEVLQFARAQKAAA